jgi:hypothetical protein
MIVLEVYNFELGAKGTPDHLSDVLWAFRFGQRSSSAAGNRFWNGINVDRGEDDLIGHAALLL